MTELLREEIGFDGLIMTDDLDMGAILNEYGLDETIRLAIEAGNDLAMICHRVAGIRKSACGISIRCRTRRSNARWRTWRVQEKNDPPG